MLTGLTSAALAGILATAALSTSTTDLLAASEAPEGYELVANDVELTYDEIVESSPYSVTRVPAGSEAAEAVRAGQDVWSSDDDARMLREVVVWPDEASAERYLDDVVAHAGTDDLTEVESPFDGARAFAARDHADGVSVRMVVWRHGLIGAAISHFHPGPDPGADTIRAAAAAFADGITATSGFTITVTPPDEEPVVVPDSTAPETDETAADDGGIPIWRLLLWLVIIVVAIWLIVKIRRRISDASAERELEERRSRTADEIIDEARRRPRDDATSTGDPERSTDDVVAEARRRARREVDELDVDF